MILFVHACESPESLDVETSSRVATHLNGDAPVEYHVRFLGSGRDVEPTVSQGRIIIPMGGRYDECGGPTSGMPIAADASVTFSCKHEDSFLEEGGFELQDVEYGPVLDIQLAFELPFEVDCALSFQGSEGSDTQFEWLACGQLIVHARGDFDIDVEIDGAD